MAILWMPDVGTLSEESRRRQQQQQQQKQEQQQINLKTDHNKIMKNYIPTLYQTKNSLQLTLTIPFTLSRLSSTKWSYTL